MMVIAYVLVEMVAGHSRNLVDALAERPAVRVVDRVTGPYDVIITLEAIDINGISNIVADEIHSRPGVVRTTTCISLD
jgi:DNA-binding Lrp family transcriptional regulator